MKVMASIKIHDVIESKQRGLDIVNEDHSLTELDPGVISALVKHLRLNGVLPCDGTVEKMHAAIVDFIEKAVEGKLEICERAEEKRKALPKGETIFLKTVVDRNRPDKREI